MSKKQTTNHGQTPDKDSDLYRKIHALVTSILEAPQSDKTEELRKLLTNDQQAREIYTIYMHETSTLRSTGLSLPVAAELSGVLENALDTSVLDPTVEPPLAKEKSKNDSSKNINRSMISSILAAVLIFSIGSYLLRNENDLAKQSPSNLSTYEPNGKPTRPKTTNNDLDSPAFALKETKTYEGQKIATLTRTLGVKWMDSANAPEALTRLVPGQTLSFSTGQAEIVFDKGIELLVTGPAELEIISELRVVAKRGTYSARVGEQGIGFTIDTPVTSVIDLGTEFGIAVNDSGETDVAVFVGAVDLETNHGDKLSDRMRLARGQAINIDKSGQYSRIVSVSSDQFPVPGLSPVLNDVYKPLIADVRDNIRDPNSMNFYRVVRRGLRDEAAAFVDRYHQWNGIDREGIPPALRGADYVMPFNDDKSIDELKVTVDIAQPCHLLVFMDDNMKVPEWLSRDFFDSGMKIGLDEGVSPLGKPTVLGEGPGESIDSRFSIWQREITQPCQVTFGSVETPADKDLGWNMFGIAAVPLAIPLPSPIELR